MESYKNAILRNMFLSRSILFTMCWQKNINYLLQVPNINSITKEHTKFEVTPPRSKLYFLYVSSVRCNRSCNVKTEIKMVRNYYHFTLINPVLACFFLFFYFFSDLQNLCFYLVTLAFNSQILKLPSTSLSTKQSPFQAT